MSNPIVSVIIPVFNGERYLGEAIDSVLAQTVEDYEIIVVDDGSTDGSRRIAESYGERLRLVHRTQSGAGAARNHGCKLARGELLAFLDADDLWLPRKLERQLAELDRDPTLDVVFGLLEQFRSPELPADENIDESALDKPFAGYLPSAVMVRRAAFDKVGPFVEDKRVGEFIDWYMRAKELGLRMTMQQILVTRRRVHTTNVGIRHRDDRVDYLKVLKNALDRRKMRT